MLGFEIFVHSVKMVLRNLKQALQISVVPAFIGGVILIGLVLVFDISFEDISTEPNGASDAASVGAILGFLISALICMFGVMLWIVVSWHRFVLLEEYPSGIIPPLRVDRILSYFGHLLMLIVLLVVALIPAGLVIGVLSQVSALVSFVVWAAMVLLLATVFYRLTPILPGAAIGRPLTIAEAWKATSGANGAIIVLLVVSLLFQIALQLLASLLLFVPIIGALIVFFASMLIVPLINVSILTTMYGVFIEKRQLS